MKATMNHYQQLEAEGIEIIREAGGFIAPTTRLIERYGQLSLESSADVIQEFLATLLILEVFLRQGCFDERPRLGEIEDLDLGR